MGSLRNPVGPLPSSIYWRRRVVIVSVVSVLALLGTWIVVSGGGGGKNDAGGSNGKNPASTITPGPSSSGPAISQHPGGRDESGGAGAGDGGSGDAGSAGAGGAGSSGDGDDGGRGGGAGSAGSGAGDVGAGDVLPASVSLPDCPSGSLSLSLHSVHNSYSPDQAPTFELGVKNSSSRDCKVDLGPKKAVLTITPADGDDALWSSSDCPEDPAGLVFRVAAGQSITYTVKWDRKSSAPHCGRPPVSGLAKPGTYLLEAKAPGATKTQTSFVLSAD
ncbi:hypothetical protein [Streptomyces sp. NPDC005573]|uniref:hypothetical protein n=1 Tax=Streptomyces sp. NPDC005573 TaxID=3156890 RepID=UPI0033A78B2E